MGVKWVSDGEYGKERPGQDENASNTSQLMMYTATYEDV